MFIYTIIEVGTPRKYYSNNITQLQELQQAVNDIYAHGGGDCPELGMEGILRALYLVNPDSNVIVLTDASPKDADKKQEVINKANEVRNSIHFFLARDGCDDFSPYLDVANATEGIVVNQITDFEAFAEFADKVGRFQLTNTAAEMKRKREVSENCVTFHASIFTQVIDILFSSNNLVATITSPSGVMDVITATGNIAVHEIETPETGEYRLCSSLEFDYSLIITNVLDFFVEYTNENGSARTSLPPEGSFNFIAIILLLLLLF